MLARVHAERCCVGVLAGGSKSTTNSDLLNRVRSVYESELRELHEQLAEVRNSRHQVDSAAAVDKTSSLTDKRLDALLRQLGSLRKENVSSIMHASIRTHVHTYVYVDNTYLPLFSVFRLTVVYFSKAHSRLADSPECLPRKNFWGIVVARCSMPGALPVIPPSVKAQTTLVYQPLIQVNLHEPAPEAYNLSSSRRHYHCFCHSTSL